MTEYNIRLNPNCAAAVHTGLKFKAGDKGITFKIAVDELDTTGTTAKIVFQRANGTSVESDITGTDGVYTYKTLGNEFAVPGKTVADVKFYAADARVSTASFVFEVSGDTMDGLGAGAGGYSDRLEQLATEAEDAMKNAENVSKELENLLTVYQNKFGEVGVLNPKGTYNSATTYEAFDLVYYGGVSWLCLQRCTGVTPAEGAYWQLFASADGGNANKLGGLSPDKFFKSTTQKASVNANTLTDEGNYFVINGTNTPEPHGFVEVKNYHVNGFKPAADWGITYCVRQVFYPYSKTGTTVLPKTRFGLLKTALSTEWEWSEWENFADGGNAAKLGGKGASEYALSKNFESGDKYVFMQTDKDQMVDNKMYRLILSNDALYLYSSTDGGNSWGNQRLISTAADLANYLHNSGGTLAGILNINDGWNSVQGDSAHAELRARGAQKDDSNYRALRILNSTFESDTENALEFYELVNGVGSSRKILHTGNKPSGSYTGTGSATYREIQTGGVGNACIIWRDGMGAIVFPTGAAVFTASGFEWNPYIAFLNGAITMTTNSSLLNESGGTYNYRVA